MCVITNAKSTFEILETFLDSLVSVSIKDNMERVQRLDVDWSAF